jgi:hypothetical protein
MVDIKRILAAYQSGSGSDSQEVSPSAVRNIKRITARRAAAHHFGFVFDLSAEIRIGTPFVVATNGVPDITDEILQELVQ